MEVLREACRRIKNSAISQPKRRRQLHPSQWLPLFCATNHGYWFLIRARTSAGLSRTICTCFSTSRNCLLELNSIWPSFIHQRKRVPWASIGHGDQNEEDACCSLVTAAHKHESTCFRPLSYHTTASSSFLSSCWLSHVLFPPSSTTPSPYPTSSPHETLCTCR